MMPLGIQAYQMFGKPVRVGSEVASTFVRMLIARHALVHWTEDELAPHVRHPHSEMGRSTCRGIYSIPLSKDNQQLLEEVSKQKLHPAALHQHICLAGEALPVPQGLKTHLAGPPPATSCKRSAASRARVHPHGRSRELVPL